MTLDNTLLPAAQDSAPNPTLDDITKTVGPAWEVLENLEGQFLFKHRETQTTSWLHPEAHIYKDSVQRG